MKLAVVAALSAALFGCASTSEIDLSKAETSCAQSCSNNYSACVSKFTLFPIRVQRECPDALKLCAQACPARSATISTK